MKEKVLEEHFKKTTYVFFMLLLGQISFFVVSLILVENNNIKNESNLDATFKILIPLVGIIVMFLANKIYNKNISKIPVNDKIENKLDKYRTFKIVQWALIEGGGFFSLIGFIITNNYLYAIIFLFLLGYYILLKPAKAQLKIDMKI